MMPKILLIGSQGQVGQELEKILPEAGELISLSRAQLDLSQSEAIARVIETIKPNFVVNAAAYTAVDKAESEPELAWQINAQAPAIMAQSSERIGATLLHISTDYVFNGQKNTPYLESDLSDPLGVYGLSKRDGEELIKKAKGSHIILRTAWVYGLQGKGNFVKTMLRLGQEREILKIVSDQIGSPTWSYDIAMRIAEIIKNIEKVPTGIYHFTDSGSISWYDFAMNIFEEAGKLGIPLKLQQVIPINTDQYPTPAKRPAYSVLSNQKLTDCLGSYPPYWRDSLKKMLAQVQ